MIGSSFCTSGELRPITVTNEISSECHKQIIKRYFSTLLQCVGRMPYTANQLRARRTLSLIFSPLQFILS